MDRRNRAIRRPILEPRDAIAAPCRARHKGLRVGEQVVYCILRRTERLNVLGLAFFDDTSEILCHVLGDSKDTAVADGGVGAQERYNYQSNV